TPSPRDLVGYGGNPPHPHWPGEARIAVNFVVNYEEGSEYNVHDDGFSEATLTEAGAADYGGKGRDLAAEGLFEYGSRVGFWRLGPSVDRRRPLVEDGGFLHGSDAYNDELPYWVRVNERPHLVVPYSLTANDSKFGRGGFFTADDYFTFVKDGFDVLYREGR